MPVELIVLAVGMALFYFIGIRPAQKRLAEQTTLQSSIEPGARVLLGSGIHATVLHVAQRTAIVELAPGVEVTVQKSAILSTVKPEDEEFEYEDETGSADDGVLPAELPTEGATAANPRDEWVRQDESGQQDTLSSQNRGL